MAGIPLHQQKEQLRRQLRFTLRCISPLERRRAGQAACQHLQQRGICDSAEVMLLHASLAEELSTKVLFEWSLSQGKRCAFARALPERKLEFAFLDDLSRLKKGRLGVLEPPSDSPLWQGEGPSCAIVPGLGFDQASYRLGRGGGYYDALLAEGGA